MKKKTRVEKSGGTVPLNTVEINYYRWDIKGKVSFSKVINLVFREEKKN